MSEVLQVNRAQVAAARALVKLAGGEDKVEPLIAQIAKAEPAPNGRPKP